MTLPYSKQFSNAMKTARKEKKRIDAPGTSAVAVWLLIMKQEENSARISRLTKKVKALAEKKSA